MKMTDPAQVRAVARTHLTVHRTAAGRVVVRGKDAALAACGFDPRDMLRDDPALAESALAVSRLIGVEAERLCAVAERQMPAGIPTQKEDTE